LERELIHAVPHIHIPAPRRDPWPSVCVVVATRDRPYLLRRALASVLSQHYPGRLRVAVVFDQVAPDRALADRGARPVDLLENQRTPGFAGARNTGVLAAQGSELVALCADDDTWAPGKLAAQVAALRANPYAVLATCAAEVQYGARQMPLLAGGDELDVARLARSSGRRIYPSSFLARRSALVDGPVGLLAEHAPAACQDWDLVVRAARYAPLAHVDSPLVRVLWRRVPGGGDGVDGQIRALHWMMHHHAEVGQEPAAAARALAEIACWHAAAGRRQAAWRSAVAAVRHRWFSVSALGALAAAAGAFRGRALLGALRYHRLP
jgi:hypothetical protein